MTDSDKHGWPWVEALSGGPPTLKSGRPWPRISVVMPSFNQGNFIEESLRSIIMQGYPNLQLLVLDGGSTDDSVKIIQRYESHISYWRSARDRGQGSAVNEGLSRADGAIIGWLNSDDLYCPHTLRLVAEAFDQFPNSEWVTGGCRWQYVDGREEAHRPGTDSPLFQWLLSSPLHEPATFWRSSLHQHAGTIDENLHYALDGELFFRFRLMAGPPLELPEDLAIFRMHESNKSSVAAQRFRRELISVIFPRYLSRIPAEQVSAARAGIAEKCLRLAFDDLRHGHFRSGAAAVAQSVQWSPTTVAGRVADRIRRLLPTSTATWS